jgi:hypothetical protein
MWGEVATTRYVMTWDDLWLGGGRVDAWGWEVG